MLYGSNQFFPILANNEKIHGDRVFDCVNYICRNGRGRPDDESMDDYISAVHGDRFFPGDGSVPSIKEKVVAWLYREVC